MAAFLRAEGGKRTGELLVRRRSSLLVPQHQSELIKAAAKGDVAVMRKLLENGADPLAGDYDRRCPLHLASEEGHLEAVEVLLAAGANIDAKDRWGGTPLKGAIRNTHGDVANYLKDHGAKTDKFAEHRTYAGNQRLVKNFFKGILGASAAPTTELLPMTALVTRLQGDHGFQVADHPVLRDELALISRRPDEASAAAYLKEHGDVREALEEYRGHFTSCFGADVFFAADFADLVLHVHAEHERQGALELPDKATLVSDIVLDRLEVKNWTAFCSNLRALFEEVLAGPNDGNNADYIPELKFAPSDRFAVSVCTVHGQRVNLGDTDSFFSMQSVSKAFAYTRALKIHGKEFVHRHVGQEPSGRAFNDFALTRQNTPFNPVTNAGAIVTASMLESSVEDIEERLKPYKKFVGDMAGGVEIGDCMDVYHSEQDCAFRNYALANFMMAEGTFPKDIDTHEKIASSVQFYLRLCSSRVSASILANVASTYANFGTSPLTGQNLVSESDVKQTLQILYSCGMYDFSGEWACTIGMPAKSGVSGEIFVVVPGVLGLCVWSPRLDQCGNSVRSIRLCQKFAEKFRLSVLDVLFRQKDTCE